MSNGSLPPQRMLNTWIDQVPKLRLGFVPTPLMPMDRLSEALGGPRLWIKRDDCTGLATGGNKTRKLEYLLADARTHQADTVITFGAVQSNHARQTAAACAALGLDCQLILARKVPWQHPAYESSGNVLLDRLLGATVHLVAPEDAQAAAERLMTELNGAGRTVYVIPVGGSNAVGALGYVACAEELLDESDAVGFELTDVLHASSSAGTQSGLVAGFAAAGLPVCVHGINVSEPDPGQLQNTVLQIASEVLSQHQPETLIADNQILVDSRFMGEAYGLPGEGTVDAVRLLARTEGIITDPVYSGKAAAGLIQRVRAGEFDDVDNVVFVHTGGAATLAVYDNLLS